MDIILKLKDELNVEKWQVEAAVKLIDEGNTIPFISRYRKEATGSLNDEVLRNLYERLTYLRNLEDKKQQVLGSIEEQGMLTDELKEKILAAETMVVVEDLYRPYRPKRKTRASVAKEKGLDGLAQTILAQETTRPLIEEAENYVSEEKEAVKTDERKTNFDRNAGLQYCRGDEMFYRELLAQFHSESVKKRQMIEADYEQKNMEDYRIRVHALKSTAKMIGAENLSDLAKDLEMAAKEKDWDFIEKNHKEVLDQYAAAVVEIGSLLGTVLEEEEFSVTQINSEKLLEELMLLMEKLRAYEIDDAEKIIQKLQHIKCANLSGRELIGNIKQDVTDFEFDRALNKTEKLYKRVERGECE